MTGFKLRKRKIINKPTGGTGNCPHLVEAIPCEEPSCYDWLVVTLDECLPDNDRDCGPGTQVPRVQCVNSDGEYMATSAGLESAMCRVRVRCRVGVELGVGKGRLGVGVQVGVGVGLG